MFFDFCFSFTFGGRHRPWLSPKLKSLRRASGITTRWAQPLGNAYCERRESRLRLRYYEEPILVLHVLATIQQCVRLVNVSVRVKLQNL